MGTGFYNELQKRQCDDFSFMENIHTSFENILGTDLYKYVHGFCDSFAVVLNEIFKYPIFALIDSETKKLIHVYCSTCKNQTTYYIDVRGITDNPNLFFSEFEDEFDMNQEEGIIVKQFKNQSEFLRFFEEATPVDITAVLRLKKNKEFVNLYRL